MMILTSFLIVVLTVVQSTSILAFVPRTAAPINNYYKNKAFLQKTTARTTTTTTHGFRRVTIKHNHNPINILSLVKEDQQLEVLLDENNIDGALQYLQLLRKDGNQSASRKIPYSLASKLITLAATTTATTEEIGMNVPLIGETAKIIKDPIGGGEYTAKELVGSNTSNNASSTGSKLVSPIQEQRLVQSYTLLKDMGVGESLFQSKNVRDLVLPTGSGCSIEQLERYTELPLKSFRPNPTIARLYWLGAVGTVLLEIIIAQVLHISPQPLFGATFAALFVDQLLGGAYSELIMWTLFPQMKDRVIHHEAGHLLVAHLLGCPVQSITLGAWDALSKDSDTDGQRLIGAGTSFFDPDLNEASMKGLITRSIVDRYSVILMAGIAAEALCFGEAEGGSDDEKSLTEFLSETVQVNQNIPEQARWAATNALTLLKENRDAYERLVTALQKGGNANIGTIMMALEGYE